MKLKILSIDYLQDDERIHHYSFYKSPSFADFDSLIIDPHLIPEIWTTSKKVITYNDGSLWAYSDNDDGFSKALKEIINRRAKETQLLLEITGGIVICFLRNKRSVLNCAPNKYKTEDRSIIHSYSWIPTREFSYTYRSRTPYSNKVEVLLGKYKLSSYTFDPSPRLGKEISEIDKSHPFSQYFIALRDNIYFEAVLSDSGLCNVSKPIAKNKVGEVIALEIPFGKGKFIFLPPFDESVDPKKVSGILIDCIRKSLQWTPPLTKPHWLKEYSLPEEEGLQEKMKDTEEKLKTILREKEELQKEVDEIELLKGLLYESGKYGLEPPVRKAFRILGFNVLEPEEYDKPYDLFVTEEGLLVIGEIEGSKGSVDVEKYRQLLDYVTETTLGGERCKGILIGNGYVDIEPSKRPEQFTEHAIRGCENQKYCRMTTTELYKAINTVLSEPKNQKLKDLIKERILSCEGEFKFDVLR